MKASKLQTRTLGEICDVKKGTSITKLKVTEGDIPVIAGGQQPAYYHNVANRQDAVITISASGAYAGFINYFETPIFASDCTTIQSKNESIVLTRYVHLILKSQQKKIYGFQTGAGQPHVYAKDLIKIEIPLPPLPVQKQIVAILERVEKLKEKRELANEETCKMIQSLFYEMFGDPVKNEKGWNKLDIGQCCQVKGGKRIPKGMKFSDIQTNRPYLRVTDMRENTIISKEIKYISEDIFSKIKRYIISSDNVYITIAGSIGLVGTIPTKYNGASLTENAAKLVFDEMKINKIYLVYMLNSKYCQKQIEIHTHTVGVPKLALFRIEKIEILLPPIELQNQFALYVERMTSINSKQQQSTQEINQLFDALMQKTFAGELTI